MKKKLYINNNNIIIISLITFPIASASSPAASCMQSTRGTCCLLFPTSPRTTLSRPVRVCVLMGMCV